MHLHSEIFFKDIVHPIQFDKDLCVFLAYILDIDFVYVTGNIQVGLLPFKFVLWCGALRLSRCLSSAL